MEKKIPFKNYIILGLVVGVTVLAVFYIRNWYIMTKIYNNTSPMLDVVSEINADEISNYVMENQNFIIYVSSSTNDNVKGFEKNFSKYIVDKGISNNILYINMDTNESSALSHQLISYAITENVKKHININCVSMYIFENGRITNVISEVDKIKMSQIDKLFKEYGMIDNA